MYYGKSRSVHTIQICQIEIGCCTKILNMLYFKNVTSPCFRSSLISLSLLSSSMNFFSLPMCSIINLCPLDAVPYYQRGRPSEVYRFIKTHIDRQKENFTLIMVFDRRGPFELRAVARSILRFATTSSTFRYRTQKKMEDGTTTGFYS